jgi:hypothetical protein
VAVVVLMGRNDASPSVTTTATTQAGSADATEGGPPGGGTRVSGAEAGVEGYDPYVPTHPGYSYRARLPVGSDWLPPEESELTSGRLLRTTVRGPDGLVLIIDRTPSDVPDLGGDFESQRTVAQPVFGHATEYVISSSDRIPECSENPCVDYLIEDGNGGGWGVLTGGPDFALARQVGAKVAGSISYTGE